MFPLLLLQPLPDADHRWSGLRIAGELDAETLGRLAGPMGLTEAAAGLELRVPAATLDALGGRVPGLRVLADDGAVPPPPPAMPAHAGPALAVLLKLLQQLTGDADTHEIETTLKHDPELSVQLLRLVNSVAFAPAKKIASFGQAITLLGRRQLQRWLQLLLYARQGAGGGPNPLLTRAAWRAAMMEGLCRQTGGSQEARDEAFMVGMFSLLEPLFGKPLAEILEPLRLAEEITAALLRHEGRLGRLLALVEAAGDGRADLAARLAELGVAAEAWCAIQIEALRWALQVDRES